MIGSDKTEKSWYVKIGGIGRKKTSPYSKAVQIIITTLVLPAVFLIFPPHAKGGEEEKGNNKGNEILNKVDEVSNAPKSSVGIMRMILIDSDGNRKERRIKIWTKKKGGETMRLMKFISPAEYRNVGFLSITEDRMYVYLPEFGRVRRISSSAKSDRFMGSDLSYDDLGTSRRAKHYNAEIIKEDEKTWTLLLTRKKGSDKPYPKIELTVDKSNFTTVQSKMYDEGGSLWKIMKAEHQKSGKYWIAKKIEVEDVKAKHKTVLEFINVKTDVKIPKRVFSKRTLKKRVEQIKP